MVHLFQEKEFTEKGGFRELSTVVEFFSPTCGPCRQLSIVLEEISEQYPDVLFTAVDITTNCGLTAFYDICSVPTLLFLKQGDIRDRLTGMSHPMVIKEGIRKITV